MMDDDDDDDDHDRGMHGGWHHDCGCYGWVGGIMIVDAMGGWAS